MAKEKTKKSTEEKLREAAARVGALKKQLEREKEMALLSIIYGNGIHTEKELKEVFRIYDEYRKSDGDGVGKEVTDFNIDDSNDE